MTDSVRSGGPAGPPWSVDLLADLHAGVLDSELSARLWPQVNADPDARAVIEALDVIKVELGQLGSAPAEPMPAHFAARLDAALTAEARRFAAPPQAPAPPPIAPVVDLAEARRRRTRRLAWGAGVLATAAAAVAVVVAVFPGSTTTGGSAVAGNKPPASNGAKAPLEVESGNLSAAIGGVTNEKDYGPLQDQEHLDACIRANDIDPTKVQTVGVRQVVFDGKHGIMAMLTTGETGQFRILVVEPTCGPGNPGKIANMVWPHR
jgi:anti-sigma factor RsiW